MSGQDRALNLGGSLLELTRSLLDVSSVSGDEKSLADAIEKALVSAPHLEVLRLGNTVAARTTLGRDHRIVWAGHLDTVPVNKNLPSEIRGDYLWGRGSVDMKAGVAVALTLALELDAPDHDVTWIFYDNEEVDSSKNGLGLFVAAHPEWVTGHFAVVGEPSNGIIEAGCNGTLRVEVVSEGQRAHSARSWMGRNAIHAAGDILDVLRSYTPRDVVVDGLVFKEGLNAVGISGGVAGNVIPDACTVTINYRFAPVTSVDEAIAHVESLFPGFSVTVVDSAPAAKPGTSTGFAKRCVEQLDVPVAPKFGWTDVARFATLGIPAINFGPGDPSLAHTDDERVEIAQIESVYERMKALLASTK